MDSTLPQVTAGTRVMGKVSEVPRAPDFSPLNAQLAHTLSPVSLTDPQMRSDSQNKEAFVTSLPVVRKSRLSSQETKPQEKSVCTIHGPTQAEKTL